MRATPATDPRAAPIVRLLEDHYRNVTTLQGIFLERYSDARNSAAVESGTVYFSRPGRMRWDYESPEKKLFLSDGKTVWFFVPSDRTVSRAPVKDSTDWRTPLALLIGKVKLTELCDRIDWTGPAPAAATSGTAGNVLLTCWPRGEGKAASRKKPADEADAGLAASPEAFNRVLLEINPVSGALADVRVDQPGGVEIEYRFGNWMENVALDASLFHFEPPKGVAIVNEAVGSTP